MLLRLLQYVMYAVLGLVAWFCPVKESAVPNDQSIVLLNPSIACESLFTERDSTVRSYTLLNSLLIICYRVVIKGVSSPTTVSSPSTLYWTDGSHPFVQAVVTSWNYHFPLVLQPIHIWLLIVQAISQHRQLHAMELQRKWFTKSGNLNDEVFDESELRTYYVHAGLADDLCWLDRNKTATLLAPLSIDYHRMEIKHPTFVLNHLGGFPSVVMDDSLETWKRLRKETEEIIRKQCLSLFADRWLAILLPLLDKWIEEYSAGQGDPRTWNPSTWINVFFPYLADGSSNPSCLALYRKKKIINQKELPVFNGVSAVPLHGEEGQWLFSGFVAVSQNMNSKQISPVIVSFYKNV